MIIPITMFGCTCDGCNEQWFDETNYYIAFTDESSIKDNVSNDETWHTDGDKHYCPACHKIDDDDNLILIYH